MPHLIRGRVFENMQHLTQSEAREFVLSAPIKEHVVVHDLRDHSMVYVYWNGMEEAKA